MRASETHLTAAGPVTVERHLCHPKGRSSKSICSLELRAGIVRGLFTPRVARQGAFAIAHLTSREAAELFEELGGMRPSHSALDRLPKELSGHWETRREEWEAALSLHDAEGERLSTVRYGRIPERKKATCKTLVTQRMKQSGMSWSRVGGQVVLTLRSLIQSKRWKLAWTLLRADFCKTVNVINDQYALSLPQCRRALTSTVLERNRLALVVITRCHWLYDAQLGRHTHGECVNGG